MIAATAMNFSSLSVIMNALRLKKYKAINILLNKNEILFFSPACTTYPLTYKFIKNGDWYIFINVGGYEMP